MLDVQRLCFAILCACLPGTLAAQQSKSFADLKREGAARSSYRNQSAQPASQAVPEPALAAFRQKVQPILAKACTKCHGEKKQKGNLRVDTLDPDLFHGKDVDWWLEVQAVLTNGEMPPEDEEDAQISDAERTLVLDWLTDEVQAASLVRRGTAKHSSFRRMTRYEYSYALQDLLGRPFDFGADLPPDPVTHDGFANSSEMLHLSPSQFRDYLTAARKALSLVTAEGERPAPLIWSVSMDAAAAREWQKQDKRVADAKKKHAKDPKKLEQQLKKLRDGFKRRPGGAHFRHKESGRLANQSWGYGGAKHRWNPTDTRPDIPATTESVLVLPQRRTMIVELGDRLPDRGTMRVRVRAARAKTAGPPPSMELLFGWQASNDSSANFRASDREIVVAAAPGEPQFYQWDVAMSQVYPRNLMRGTQKLGQLPNPSEYLKIRNSSLSAGDIVIDHVEVMAPVYDVWPPSSHEAIFAAAEEATADEAVRARAILAAFLPKAWRRDVTEAELDRKQRLFTRVRSSCGSFVEAVRETLAVVLSSPNFLYVVESADDSSQLSPTELATRLSMFLWCSTPDAELRALAKSGRLRDPQVLAGQAKRLLRDPKAERLSDEFVRQWLNLELLDFLHVDKKAHRDFDPALKEAMGQEPIVFFREMLANDLSVLEFVQCNFAMVNERLARHYGLKGVTGNQFRRVDLPAGHRRGGLLTQAGLLAMNSDGIDSHPLKRGIWLLERLLNDPPPPPPAAVPEIDLADPRIAKMTLKERIEDHRNHAACMACHQKIDPWGIAFEDFDAIGKFRTEINGKPVDSVSTLFNKQKLDGTDGLKRFLLEHRQDQFVRALVHKLTTFALGRPLAFGDRAAIDEITAKVRMQGDGLATMVAEIVTSELFRSK